MSIFISRLLHWGELKAIGKDGDTEGLRRRWGRISRDDVRSSRLRTERLDREKDGIIRIILYSISMLGAKVSKAVDREVAELFANPDGDRVNALADAIARSVETVTKRKAGPVVHGYALMQVKHVILEAALANKKQMAAVEGLFDDEERLLLAQETNSRNAPILARAINAVVNAALTSCNRPN